MNTATTVILLLLAAAIALAVRQVLKGRTGSCHGCSCDCSKCTKQH